MTPTFKPLNAHGLAAFVALAAMAAGLGMPHTASAKGPEQTLVPGRCNSQVLSSFIHLSKGEDATAVSARVLAPLQWYDTWTVTWMKNGVVSHTSRPTTYLGSWLQRSGPSVPDDSTPAVYTAIMRSQSGVVCTAQASVGG